MRHAILAGIGIIALGVTAQAQIAVSAPYSQLLGGETLSGTIPAYVNFLDMGYYFPAGAGVAVADDLRLDTAGLVDSFQLAYYDGGAPGATDVRVRFYGGSVAPENLIADFGFYGMLTDPSTAFVIGADLVGTGFEFVAPQDLIMETEFSSATAGWLLASPPFVGSSADGFLIDGAGPFTFEGGQTGDFFAGVFVAPEPAGLIALATGFVGLASLHARRRA